MEKIDEIIQALNDAWVEMVSLRRVNDQYRMALKNIRQIARDETDPFEGLAKIESAVQETLSGSSSGREGRYEQQT